MATAEVSEITEVIEAPDTATEFSRPNATVAVTTILVGLAIVGMIGAMLVVLRTR